MNVGPGMEELLILLNQKSGGMIEDVMKMLQGL